MIVAGAPGLAGFARPGRKTHNRSPSTFFTCHGAFFFRSNITDELQTTPRSRKTGETWGTRG